MNKSAEKLDLRTLLELPESVQKSQFVVVLSKAVDDPASVVRKYAVTDQIRDAYDQALGYVKSAIDEQQNVGKPSTSGVMRSGRGRGSGEAGGKSCHGLSPISFRLDSPHGGGGAQRKPARS